MLLNTAVNTIMETLEKPQAFVTTLKALRQAGACYEGYNRVVRALQELPFTEEDSERTSYIRFKYDGNISLKTILESNGLDDALWALRSVEGHDRDKRLFAVWCARQAAHLNSDPRVVRCLNTAERFANEEASQEELTAASDAAGAAAWAARDDASAASAASDAAGAAAWAASAAASAASAASAAASDAAGAAAWAARDAAGAAWAASAAASAASAASAAASAARDSQKEMFLKMISGTAPWQS